MKNFDFLQDAVNSKIALSAITDEMAEFEHMTKTGASIPPALEARRRSISERFERILKNYMDIEERALTELEKIKNGNLVCLLQWKYLCGLTWQQISEKLPDKPSTDALKKRFQRYVKEYESQCAGE